MFVTGTDTGVGKTLLTGLLLAHLRRRGERALAVKPFCSGGREDAEFLLALQDGELALEEINPFFFPEPVAPLASAAHGPGIEAPLRHIRAIARRCEWLLIEGAGGLLAPLGKNYFVLDLIRRLRCRTLLVAPNRLGTINHTLLSLRALETPGARNRALGSAGPRVVMMDCKTPDVSARTNTSLLRRLAPDTPLISLPFFAGDCANPKRIRRLEKKVEKSIARILE